jgi:trigger factor
MVKVTKEKTEDSQAFLTIEMEPAEVEESLDEAYHRLVKKASIPGFRKGKAPRQILEQYLGKESFLEDALNAIAEQQIEAFARPQIEIVQTEPVIFKATVPLAPVVELGDYHHIHVTADPVEVTEDNVSAVIEQLRHQNATWESVERAVAFEDLVVLDVKRPFINQEGGQYQVFRDSPFPAPGFAKQLPGMKKGEEKEFKLKLPSDYPKTELAGKEPFFKVRVVEIKQEILPELNNEFVKQLGPELKTVAALRKEVTSNLKLRAEEKARADFEERVIEAVTDLSQVTFPPVLVDMEIHRLIDEQSRRFQMQGGNLEEYLKSINKTEAQLHEELHPVATKRVTHSLVLGKVAEEEKVEVIESEIDAEIENMLKSATENKEELQKVMNTPQSRGSMKQILMTRKTISRLVEIAQGSKASTKRKKKEAKK